MIDHEPRALLLTTEQRGRLADAIEAAARAAETLGDPPLHATLSGARRLADIVVSYEGRVAAECLGAGMEMERLLRHHLAPASWDFQVIYSAIAQSCWLKRHQFGEDGALHWMGARETHTLRELLEMSMDLGGFRLPVLQNRAVYDGRVEPARPLAEMIEGISSARRVLDDPSVRSVPDVRHEAASARAEVLDVVRRQVVAASDPETQCKLAALASDIADLPMRASAAAGLRVGAAVPAAMALAEAHGAAPGAAVGL